MPELPEVETVVRSLRGVLTGRHIQAWQIFWPRSLDDPELPATLQQQADNRITGLTRRAKWILVLFANGSRIGIHLRMTGRLYPVSMQEWPTLDKHLISWAWQLDESEWLVFADQRRFGRTIWLPDENSYNAFNARFGPEPLGRKFTTASLFRALQGSRRQIKPWLLDQTRIAGLGNIYVDESLWLAQIHPQTATNLVPPKQAQLLRDSIRKVLRRAIAANGTTFMNFKFLSGSEGGYTDELLVFRRQGQPCPRCQGLIERIQVAQRSTHFCPQCQPWLVRS
ncbi:MAG: DNA-formamidopyrimidine glycosylase [Leptospiraceae bacterium]|nr:DNA-formamidopyrimidine glycosylase [Leptospiraceae bacterium]